MYILVLLTLFSGVFEGVGIGLFLPILNYESNRQATNVFSSAVYKFLSLIGMPISLLSLLILLFFVFLGKGVCTYLQVLATQKITTDLNRELCQKIATEYTLLSYEYYTQQTVGYFNNLITTEVNRAVSGIAKYCDLISCFIYIAIYLLLASLIDYQMTLFVLFVSLIFINLFRFLYKLSASYSMKISDCNALLQSTLIQILHNFKYLKATNSFSALIVMLNKHISRLTGYSFKLGALGGILSSFVEPVVIFCMCILVVYHVSFQGNPLAEIMILLIFFHRTFGKVFSFQIALQKFNGSIGGVSTVENAMMQFRNNYEPLSKTKRSVSFGDITFSGVDFFYGDKQVLFDVNMCIKRNTTVAIVGESGAGKTTFFDLLTGLLHPQAGQISIGGTPYSCIDLKMLRSHFGYVTQEPVIFNDTVANNICFWTGDANRKECLDLIRKAAKIAHCDQFISELLDGYQTKVGDKGSKLSGGQCQRIAIAREIFKEPDVLIFDEATSSLDSKSERYIQESLSTMKGSRTLIIIAHRLSTIKESDYIYLFSKGRIVESGTYEDLYCTEGAFRQMCLAQNL